MPGVGPLLAVAAFGRAEQLCGRVRAPQGRTVGHFFGEGSYLVLEVTPRGPGTVRVKGLRVCYRDGLRRGEQLSGLTVVVRATAAR